jgi:hypothetical protein
MRIPNNDTYQKPTQLFDILTRHKIRRTGSKPLQEAEILRRIAHCLRLNQKIQLIYFWGGAKESSDKVVDSAEEKALDLIDETVALLNVQEVQCEVVIIFSDIHACKINGIPENDIETYFSSLYELLERRKSHYSLVRLSHIYHKHLPELFEKSAIKSAQLRIARIHQENRDFITFIRSISQRHSKLPIPLDKIARKYLLRRILEDRIIGKEFPLGIFVSYTNPEIIKNISLLPTIFSYSLKRGVSACPWFIEDRRG